MDLETQDLRGMMGRRELGFQGLSGWPLDSRQGQTEFRTIALKAICMPDAQLSEQQMLTKPREATGKGLPVSAEGPTSLPT